MANITRLGSIIIAILDLARNEGQNKVLRTVIIKLLYLVDFYTAEVTDGKETLTGLEWRFYHFGPYSFDAAKELDSLSKIGRLAEEKVENEKEQDKEYKLYSLQSFASPKSLSDLGVHSSVKLKLGAAIKAHRTLSSLLNYVYFETTPMLDAKPGDILSFSSCKKMKISDFKTIVMKPLNNKKLSENKRKLKELINKRETQPHITFPGVYDEVYEKAMATLSSEPIPKGFSGKANINIKKSKGHE